MSVPSRVLVVAVATLVVLCEMSMFVVQTAAVVPFRVHVSVTDSTAPLKGVAVVAANMVGFSVTVNSYKGHQQRLFLQSVLDMTYHWCARLASDGLCEYAGGALDAKNGLSGADANDRSSKFDIAQKRGR